MARIGAMDRKVVVEVRQKPDATDGFGARTEAWSEYGERWAQVGFSGESESARAETTASSEERTFKIRYDRSLFKVLTPGNARIRYKDKTYDSRVWNIVGLVLYGRNETIEVRARTER